LWLLLVLLWLTSLLLLLLVVLVLVLRWLLMLLILLLLWRLRLLRLSLEPEGIEKLVLCRSRHLMWLLLLLRLTLLLLLLLLLRQLSLEPEGTDQLRHALALQTSLITGLLLARNELLVLRLAQKCTQEVRVSLTLHARKEVPSSLLLPTLE
jgi:hypothetical protein